MLSAMLTALREEPPRLHIHKLPPSRGLPRGKTKLKTLVLRRSNRIARSAIDLRVDGSLIILDLHQLEMNANCVVLIEKCGDLFFELRPAIHARKIKSTQHFSRAVTL